MAMSVRDKGGEASSLASSLYRERLPTWIVRELLDDLAVELVFQQVLQQIKQWNKQCVLLQLKYSYSYVRVSNGNARTIFRGGSKIASTSSMGFFFDGRSPMYLRIANATRQ